MDRTAQRAAFTNAIQPFFDAQDKSDQLAAQAGQTRQAKEAAERTYNQTASPAKKEALKQPLLDLQQKDADDTAASTEATLASQNLYVVLGETYQQLDTNPGMQEQMG